MDVDGDVARGEPLEACDDRDAGAEPRRPERGQERRLPRQKYLHGAPARAGERLDQLGQASERARRQRLRFLDEQDHVAARLGLGRERRPQTVQPCARRRPGRPAELQREELDQGLELDARLQQHDRLDARRWGLEERAQQQGLAGARLAHEAE